MQGSLVHYFSIIYIDLENKINMETLRCKEVWYIMGDIKSIKLGTV